MEIAPKSGHPGNGKYKGEEFEASGNVNKGRKGTPLTTDYEHTELWTRKNNIMIKIKAKSKDIN